MRKYYFASVKFFVLLRIKRLLHENRRQDKGNLSPKKQTRADAYLITEISMIKHSSVYQLLKI